MNVEVTQTSWRDDTAFDSWIPTPRHKLSREIGGLSSGRIAPLRRPNPASGTLTVRLTFDPPRASRLPSGGAEAEVATDRWEN